jgi:hypothetical protein
MKVATGQVGTRNVGHVGSLCQLAPAFDQKLIG